MKVFFGLIALVMTSNMALAMKIKWDCKQGESIYGSATILADDNTATVYPFDMPPYTLAQDEFEIDYDQTAALGVMSATISDLVNNQSWQCKAALVPAQSAQTLKNILIPRPIPGEITRRLHCFILNGELNVLISENGTASIMAQHAVIETLAASEYEIQDTVVGYSVMFVNLKNHTRMMCNSL